MPLKSSDLIRWLEGSQEGIAYRATVSSFYQVGIVKVIFKNLYISSHFAITHGRVKGITYVKVSPSASFSFGSIPLSDAFPNRIVRRMESSTKEEL